MNKINFERPLTEKNQEEKLHQFNTVETPQNNKM